MTRAGFYEWLHKPMSDRAIEDLQLLALIRASYIASGGVYGSPHVFGDLREAGETCGKHRVARIMRMSKIKALRGYKAPRHIDGRPSIISPNTLNRKFTDAPDRVWVTDITYLRTWQGWLYRGRHGSVRAQDRGVVDEADAGARAGPGCAADGAVATQAPTRGPGSLGSRHAVRQR